jgi:hypothetical protein
MTKRELLEQTRDVAAAIAAEIDVVLEGKRGSKKVAVELRKRLTWIRAHAPRIKKASQDPDGEWE